MHAKVMGSFSFLRKKKKRRDYWVRKIFGAKTLVSKPLSSALPKFWTQR